jgi:Mg/Co/Ni transporter MgtE
MSPRAAWRLETLGFTQVYDYVAGKADWVAEGLPREGTQALAPVIGDLARRDVPTCALESRVGNVQEQIQASEWDQCVVVNEERVVLGRARLDDLGDDPNATIERVMQDGPSTFRPNVGAHEMGDYMRRRGKMSDTLVTDPEGRLIGVVRRDDIEAAVHRWHSHERTAGKDEER